MPGVPIACQAGGQLTIDVVQLVSQVVDEVRETRDGLGYDGRLCSQPVEHIEDAEEHFSPWRLQEDLQP